MAKKLNITNINKLVKDARKLETEKVEIDGIEYEYGIKTNLLNSDKDEYRTKFLEFVFNYMQTDEYNEKSEIEQSGILDNFIVGLSLKVLTDLEFPDDFKEREKMLIKLNDLGILLKIIESLEGNGLLDELSEVSSELLSTMQSQMKELNMSLENKEEIKEEPKEKAIKENDVKGKHENISKDKEESDVEKNTDDKKIIKIDK